MDKHQILKQYFGHKTFREGQEQLIDSLLSGRDALGIMPTGGGQVHVLSGARTDAARSDAGGVPSHLADEGSGHGAEARGHPGGLYQQLPDPGAAQHRAISACVRGRTNSSMSPRSGWRPDGFLSLPLRVWTSPCWRWTRPTASPSGGRISGPATCKIPDFLAKLPAPARDRCLHRHRH